MSLKKGEKALGSSSGDIDEVRRCEKASRGRHCCDSTQEREQGVGHEQVAAPPEAGRSGGSPGLREEKKIQKDRKRKSGDEAVNVGMWSLTEAPAAVGVHSDEQMRERERKEEEPQREEV